MLLRMPPSWAGEFLTLPADDALEHTLEMAGVGVKERGESADDTWTLEITSNRGDLLSAHGLARDLAAMSGETLQASRVPARNGENLGDGDGVAVHMDAPDACSSYTARLLEVEVGPSPDWMQQRLEKCGMRPINNVVDISNYVMLELGQPLHAFDANKLKNHIVVRVARDGETLRTLDDAERALSAQMLVIADENQPIALAGVMGGLSTEVSERTTRILLESAHFSPANVKRTSRALGLSTEASRRFERGVDPQLPARASARACELLREIANARVLSPLTEVVARPFSSLALSLRVARCNAVLGLKLSGDLMAQLLSRLGFNAQLDGEVVRVLVPSWRSDIEREIDLIEEVARLHGYAHVPTTLPRGANASAGRSLAGRLEERAKSALLRCGLTEVLTLSLTNEAAQERSGLRDDPATPRRVPLRNALSDDYTQLRTSLLPSLLDVLARNARLTLDAPPQIFELGKIYLARENASLASPQGQPEERRVIGLAMLAAPTPPNVAKTRVNADFYTLKGAVETFLHELGAPKGEFQAEVQPGFHPGRSATLSVNAQIIGVLGEIHPDVAARFDLDPKTRAYLAQLDFDALVRHVSLSRRYASLPRFPASERDLALVLRAEVSASQVETVLRNAAGEFLESLRVFDVYTGAPIPDGQKSLAVALRFRAPDRTLQEAEVEAALARARDAAKTQLEAQLRE